MSQITPFSKRTYKKKINVLTWIRNVLHVQDKIFLFYFYEQVQNCCHRERSNITPGFKLSMKHAKNIATAFSILKAPSLHKNYMH